MEFIGIVGTYIQLLTFVFSIIFLYKYNHTNLRWLPLYLGFAAFVELYCFYFFKTNNVWLYNLVIFVQLNFYLLIYNQYFDGTKRKFIWFLQGYFNFCYIGSFAFGLNDFVKEPSSYGYVAGGIVMIIMLIMCFNQMLKVSSLNGILRNLFFWLSFSLLVYYATSLPLYSITNWAGVLGDFKIVIIRIFFFSVLFTQLLLIFGFVCSKKKYTY